MAGTVTHTLKGRRSSRLVVRPALSLAGLLSWVLLAAAAGIRAIPALAGPRYAVAAVRARLLREPDWWVNWTVQVHTTIGTLAVYRVQVRAIANTLRDTGVHVEAVLVDARPGARGE